MTSHPEPLLASFKGRHVELRCDRSWLAEELRARMAHVLTGPVPGQDAVLQVTLSELEPSWLELRDSTGRCERGSFEHVVHHVRKWVTSGFVSAHPDLLWIHAAAASRDGFALLLPGPAGAGKSTLLVQLIDRAWLMLSDDVVALLPHRREALPLPFNPEVRRGGFGVEDDWQDFLVRPKVLARVPPAHVASTPSIVGAIVFPEYSVRAVRPRLERLTAVSATQALAPHSHGASDARGRTLGELFDLARQVPCYRLRYMDPAAAAQELTEGTEETVLTQRNEEAETNGGIQIQNRYRSK